MTKHSPGTQFPGETPFLTSKWIVVRISLVLRKQASISPAEDAPTVRRY